MRASAAWAVTAFVGLLAACGEDTLAPVRAQLELNRHAVDFGPTNLGAQKSSVVVMRNVGRAEVQVEDVRVAVPGISLGPLSLTRLEPGQATRMEVLFEPWQEGTVDGVVDIRTSTEDAVLLGVKGRGVRPQGGAGTLPTPEVHIPETSWPTHDAAVATCLVVSPAVLGFGLVPQGMSVTKTFEVRNRCRNDVRAGPFALSATQGGRFVLGAKAAGSQPTTLHSGGTFRVEVTFAPEGGTRTSLGDIIFGSQDGQGQNENHTVHLVGSSRPFEPCRFELTPMVLDFGTATPGTSPVLATVLHNRGTDACYVSRWSMSSASSPAFTTLDWSNRLVEPGRSLVLQVRFRPPVEGAFQGTAEVQLNGPTPSTVQVPVQGRAAKGCIVVEPASLDFGMSRLSCGGKTGWVTARNTCEGEVEISSVEWIASPSMANELGLVQGPAFPLTLVSGAEVRWQVRYHPTDEGVDAAELRISSVDGVTGATVTRSVGISGFGLTQPVQTDRFVQEAAPKVDVLFVIDNSGSMMEEQQNLGQNFAAFLSAAQTRGTDYQIGVTTTGLDVSRGSWTECPGGAQGGENGRLFPVDGSTPRILTPRTPNAAEAFARSVQVGWCHWNEEGLEAAYRALSDPLINHRDDPRTSMPDDGNQGFLRRDARLALIFLSDEEDASELPLEHYEEFFRGLKDNDPTRLSISAIVGPPMLQDCPTASSVGGRYIALAKANNGVVESICTPNWASALMNISSSAFGPRQNFPLSQTPGDPKSLTVRVDGAPVSTGWSYDAVRNSVRFEPGKAPPTHSVVEISYALGC